MGQESLVWRVIIDAVRRGTDGEVFIRDLWAGGLSERGSCVRARLLSLSTSDSRLPVMDLGVLPVSSHQLPKHNFSSLRPGLHACLPVVIM